MSPNEFDLRAALHHGEGDGVDPDRVIGRAVAQRQARRARLARSGSIAAVVAVVAGLGIGAAYGLHGNGGGSNSAAQGSAGTANATTAAGPAGTAPAATSPAGPAAGTRAGKPAGSAAVDHSGSTAGSASTGAGSARSGRAAADAARVACPATPPVLTTNLPSSALQHASLFSGPVEAVVACVYAPASSTSATVRHAFLGSDATAIANSIEAASSTPPRMPCPMYRIGNTRTLVLIGVDASGNAMAPISTQLGQNPCDLPITNGKAVRYDWTPPAVMAPWVTGFRSPVLGSGTVPTAHGIPVH